MDIVITSIGVIALIAVCETWISFAKRNPRLVARLYMLDFAEESAETTSTTKPPGAS